MRVSGPNLHGRQLDALCTVMILLAYLWLLHLDGLRAFPLVLQLRGVVPLILVVAGVDID